MSEQDAAAKVVADGQVVVGSLAPDFTLPRQDGTPVRLSDYRGKNAVVLYFYPKDNTAGCTAEACAFRDSYEVFKDAGAEVIGVSADSTASHQQFAGQHRLPFVLLSDEGGTVSKLYKVPKWLGLFAGRVTFVIDKQGIIRHIFNSQIAFDRHISESLATLRSLNTQASA
jgi:peroxiredoxin Q/BCP